MAARILVIEDDPAIAALLHRGLTGAGYEIAMATDGSQGLETALTGAFDLILLDRMLPGMDGLDICARLHCEHTSTAVLMLTARDGIRDRIAGLDAGADDYLAKPFDFGELLARVRALLRRGKAVPLRHIQSGDLTIDLDARTVRRAGAEIQLTAREFQLLEALASNPGRVLTREVIQERVWRNEESVAKTVDVFISTLRRKLGATDTDPIIHTVRGIGYKLRESDPQ